MQRLHEVKEKIKQSEFIQGISYNYTACPKVTITISSLYMLFYISLLYRTYNHSILDSGFLGTAISGMALLGKISGELANVGFKQKEKHQKMLHEFLIQVIKEDTNHFLIPRLLARGANVNAKGENWESDYFDSPLYCALVNHHYHIADLLKKNGAQIDQKFAYNRDLLMLIATHKKKYRGLRWLLSHGASVNAKDDNGHSALSYACIEVQPGSIALLLEHGASITNQTNNLATPLHVITWHHPSSKKMKIRALKSGIILVAHGADVNARDAFGKTPLFGASARDLIELAQYLLYEGAQPHVQDSNRQTPQAYAQSTAMIDVLNAKDKPKISKNARKIMVEMAGHKKNVASLLLNREIGKRLPRNPLL